MRSALENRLWRIHTTGNTTHSEITNGRRDLMKHATISGVDADADKRQGKGGAQ
jgi:hypothetical protein